MRTFKDDLTENLRDPEFAKRFGAAQAKSAFALTLAETRRKAGVTQQELAERFGVSQSYIAKLEGGEANPTLGTIGSLLSVLGLRLFTDAIPLLAAPGDVGEANFDTTIYEKVLRDIDQQPGVTSLVDISGGYNLLLVSHLAVGMGLGENVNKFFTLFEKDAKYTSLRDVGQEPTNTSLVSISSQ